MRPTTWDIPVIARRDIGLLSDILRRLTRSPGMKRRNDTMLRASLLWFEPMPFAFAFVPINYPTISLRPLLLCYRVLYIPLSGTLTTNHIHSFTSTPPRLLIYRPVLVLAGICVPGKQAYPQLQDGQASTFPSRTRGHVHRVGISSCASWLPGHQHRSRYHPTGCTCSSVSTTLDCE